MDLTSTTDPERIPVAPSLFGGGLGLDLLYFSCSFKPMHFFLCPRAYGAMAGLTEVAGQQWCPELCSSLHFQSRG